MIAARVAATVAILSVGAPADAAHAQHLRAADLAWRIPRPALWPLANQAGTSADRSTVPGGPAVGAVTASREGTRAGTRRWWAPLASAVVPGTGQLALRQARALACLAVEAFAWVKYGVRPSQGSL